jgi:predicted dehydrogenase
MVRVNCIGLGSWGPNIVRSMVASHRVQIGTVCDLAQDRLELVRRNVSPSINISTDPWTTAADPDAKAIIISTPISTHYELAKRAIECGKHVLVEKPLARTVGECAELVDLAREQGVHLCVGHIFLFNNGIRHVKKLIDSGELGEIRYMFSSRTNLGPVRSDVNALWDLGAHDISIFNYWLQADPVQVTAFGNSFLNPEIEDVVVANFVYPNNVMASVHASWLNPQKVREISVIGTRKMLVWNDMDLNEPVRIYDKSVDIQHGQPYNDTFAGFRMQVRSGSVVIPVVPSGPPLDAECHHFIDCVEGKTLPINDGQCGLRVVQALEAAQRSMNSRSMLSKVRSDPYSILRAA